MNTIIKNYADQGKIDELKYVFNDCLDVDPTFKLYEEEYEYCKKHIPELFEPYTEITPLTNDRSQWNKDYWVKLKIDLMDNFSAKRFAHMIDVAKVIHSEKAKSIEHKRGLKETKSVSEFDNRQKVNLENTAKKVNIVQKKTDIGISQNIGSQANESTSSISEDDKERIEKRKRQLEEERRKQLDKEEAEKIQREQRRRQSEQDNSSDMSKKVIGAAVVAAVIVLGTVIIIKAL